jgi:hypothetical protein
MNSTRQKISCIILISIFLINLFYKNTSSMEKKYDCQYEVDITYNNQNSSKKNRAYLNSDLNLADQTTFCEQLNCTQASFCIQKGLDFLPQPKEPKNVDSKNFVKDLFKRLFLLESLQITFHYLPWKHISLFFKQFLDENKKFLSSLDITFKNSLDTNEAELIKIFEDIGKNFQKLERLKIDLVNTSVGFTEVKELVKKITQLQPLKKFDLKISVNHIDKEDIKTITNILQKSANKKPKNIEYTIEIPCESKSITITSNIKNQKNEFVLKTTLILLKNKFQKILKNFQREKIQKTSQSTYEQNYTINLMWINKVKSAWFATLKDKDHTNQLIKNASAWKKENPNATINLWHDSVLIENYNEEKKRVKKLIETNSLKNVLLADIRNLSLIKENNGHIFSDAVPVYFRVDLARVIATCEELENKRTNCFVYADIDMKAISKANLFDVETMNNLNRYGIVLPRSGNLCKFENGFHMAVNDQNTLLSVKIYLIFASLKKMNEYLEKPDLLNGNFLSNFTSQIIFYSYPAMLYYLYQLKGFGQYDSNNKIFTPHKCSDSDKEHDETCKFNFVWIYKYFVPTKIVTLPEAGLNYN